MGLLGSAFGRALAGGGSAAASIAGKFIDEEIAMNRAQAMAELQRATGKAMLEDRDAFENDPTRLERNRTNKALDVTSAAQATRDAEIAGLNDPNYRGAKRKAADEDAADTTRRTAEAATVLAPLEVEKAGKMAEARAKAEAKYREPRAGSQVDIKNKVKAVEDALGRKLTEDEKLTVLGLVTKPKPDSTTEEVVTEYDAEGKQVGSKKTRKGPAGSVTPPPDPAAQLKAGIDKARADGKISEAIKELRAKGISPQDILKAGITEAELQAASQPTKPRAKPLAERTGGMLDRMDLDITRPSPEDRQRSEEVGRRFYEQHYGGR